MNFFSGDDSFDEFWNSVSLDNIIDIKNDIDDDELGLFGNSHFENDIDDNLFRNSDQKMKKRTRRCHALPCSQIGISHGKESQMQFACLMENPFNGKVLERLDNKNYIAMWRFWLARLFINNEIIYKPNEIPTDPRVPI